MGIDKEQQALADAQQRAKDDNEVATDCWGSNATVKEKSSAVSSKKDKKDCDAHGGGGGKKREKGACIRMVLNPYFKIVPWMVVASQPIVSMIVMPSVVERLGEQKGSFIWWTLTLLTGWLSLQIVYNFVMATLLEPGYVDENYLPPHSGQKTGKYKLTTKGEYDDANAAKAKSGLYNCVGWEEHLEPDTVEMKETSSNEFASRTAETVEVPKKAPKKLGLYYAPRYCAKCNVWKPPRSHHDSITGRCVLRMDHFCPFTCNVIGAKNHGHFVLMYMFSTVGLIYCSIMVVLLCYSTFTQPDVQQQIWKLTSGLSASADGDSDVHLNAMGATNTVAIEGEDAPVPLATNDFRPTAKYWFSALRGNAPGFVPGWIFSPIERLGLFTMVSVDIAHMFGKILGWDMMLLLILDVIFLIIVGACGSAAVMFSQQNITAIEYNVRRLNEYIEIAPSIFCPIGATFYTLETPWENMIQILGPDWKWRFAGPFKGRVDWQMLGYEMPIAPSAVEQIYMRIEQWKEEGQKIPEMSYAELGITPPPEGGEKEAGDAGDAPAAEETGGF